MGNYLPGVETVTMSSRALRFRRALLSGASRTAIVYQLPFLHIIKLETIMLRVGLACGLIEVPHE